MKGAREYVIEMMAKAEENYWGWTTFLEKLQERLAQDGKESLWREAFQIAEEIHNKKASYPV